VLRFDMLESAQLRFRGICRRRLGRSLSWPGLRCLRGTRTRDILWTLRQQGARNGTYDKGQRYPA
ncbi:MAG TPA: hypothetical protein VJ323_17900, partial [Bryobacteraceae bacterium]|nr:hypothetical protein [Bryobacteraceae bacterium]